jgi:hypothetical protein
MQEKSETNDTFLSRTDAVAQRMGIILEELPEMMGISRASFFGYRSGKRPVTNKAWLKLASIERVAESQKESTSIIREEYPLYRTKQITQSVATAAKNSDPMTLWERVAQTADAVARLPEPSIRLKIGEDIIEMIRAAMEKDQQTVEERSL